MSKDYIAYLIIMSIFWIYIAVALFRAMKGNNE